MDIACLYNKLHTIEVHLHCEIDVKKEHVGGLFWIAFPQREEP
jgi:hypothetical protein